MIQVTNITDDFYQSQTVNLPGGSFIFSMRYYPQQLSWFLEQVQYNGITIQGIRLSTNLNVLRQFKNGLQIGLACLTSDNFDPTQQTDFSSGYANLYILLPADIAAVENVINGQ